MTDQNYTHIVTILDRSGSMGGLVQSTISGFNEFVEGQRKAVGRATITRIQFDDIYQVDYENKDINDCSLLDTVSYVPRGMTALYDAVGKAVNTTGKWLADLDEDKRPGQVIFLIITDGEENNSKEFSGELGGNIVRQMVKHQVEKYSWRFVYIGGGDLDKQQAQASFIGIPTNNIYNYSTNDAGTKAVYASLNHAVGRSRHFGSMGLNVNAADSLLSAQESQSLITDSKDK